MFAEDYHVRQWWLQLLERDNFFYHGRVAKDLDSYCAALLFFPVNNVGSGSEYITHRQPEFWMQDSLPKHDESVKNSTRSEQYNVLAVLRYLSCS
jgi:hypothetical protein